MSESIELLEKLTQADGVPGHEGEVRRIFEEELREVGPCRRDRMGNISCAREGSSVSPRVMLDCHLDEIGFLVQRITPRGYLKFVPIGGWWNHTLPAQRVTVTTRQGKIPGVVGAVPPHLLGEGAKDKVLPTESMFIDVGAANAKDAEAMGIMPGCPVTPWSPFMRMKREKVLSAKAFDNRVGVALLIEALRKLGEHPNTVLGVGCVQEEVGLRGARSFAPGSKADVAIVLEGPPADDTFGFEEGASQGKLGAGVQIRMFDPSMIANPRLAHLAIDIARENQIPYQIAVRQSGGTNAGAIHMAPEGIPAVVLGVPARYIHSHVSLINIDDYHAALELVLKLIPRLDYATVHALTSDDEWA